MASRKADIHIGDLTEHQQAAGQLRIGEQVTISQAEGSSSFTVHSASGQHLGLITEAADRELLLSGTAVVRSIRRQEGTVVQVLLRVTQAPPAPKPAPAPAKAEQEEPTGRVTRAQFEALADTEEVRAQLKDERLQELIRDIDTAPDPEKALKLALQQHPDFVGFAERVLAIVSPQETAPQPPNPTVAAIRNLLAQQA